MTEEKRAAILEVLETYEKASAAGKDLLLRIIKVYAFGSEAGKQILDETCKDIHHLTWEQAQARLEEAEAAT